MSYHMLWVDTLALAGSPVRVHLRPGAPALTATRQCTRPIARQSSRTRETTSKFNFDSNSPAIFLHF